MPFTLLARKFIVALTSALLAATLTPALSGGAAQAAPARDRPTTAELNKRIEAAARQLEVVVERFNNSREDLRATQMQKMHLGARLKPMTDSFSQRRQVMKEVVTRTYQRTRSGLTVSLFAADEPHEFMDKLLMLHQFGAEQERAVAELNEARTKVFSARRLLNALAAQQRRQKFQLRTSKASVEGEIEALRQMRAIAYGGGSRFPRSENVGLPQYVSGPAGRVVAFAFDQIGKPYRWGSAGPYSYDCSGLTLAAWQRAGVGLPHNAARQYDSMTHVSRSELRPGDLVFFFGQISHVGVYIGDGRMIHAPEYGENIRVARIDVIPIHGYGRPS